MLSFFRKKDGEQLKMEGKESVVPSSDLIDDADQTLAEDDIETALSIHPDWNITKEDQYSFQFLNQECPPLKPNQLSLSGISLMQESDSAYRVNAFIRNSLDKAIKLENTTLVLLNEKEEILGRKEFNLSEAGEIPPRSARPWNFTFTMKDLFTEELPQHGWKLAFQLSPSSRKHSLDLADSWEKSLAEQDKEQLRNMVDNMTPPKKGEVNFLGLQAKFAETGDFHVTILIRNGSQKDINLEQIPLQVEDAAGDIIAKGGFKLEQLTVKANTSKPWSFIFPKSLVQKENADLSRWKAYAPQK